MAMITRNTATRLPLLLQSQRAAAAASVSHLHTSLPALSPSTSPTSYTRPGPPSTSLPPPGLSKAAEFVISKVEDLMNWARTGSIWPMTFGLACCAVEMILCLMPQLPSEASSSQQQVPPAFKNFSMSQKEKNLGELVRGKWLLRTNEGNIGVGIRSLLDLRSWFRNNDVPSCEVCNEAGVKADVCPNDGCTERIHRYCLKKWLSQRDDKVCSGCRKPWPLGTTTKAEAVEEALNDEEEDETSSHSSKIQEKKTA